jgi:hypothetical protein
MSGCFLRRLIMGRNTFVPPSPYEMRDLTYAQLFHPQASHFSGSRTCDITPVSFGTESRFWIVEDEGETNLWLLGLIDPLAKHKDSDVLLRRTEVVVGHGDELLGLDNKPRFLECFSLGTCEMTLSDLEVASRELQLACGRVSKIGIALQV